MLLYIKGTFFPIGDVKITVPNPTREAITFGNNSIKLSQDTGAITAIRSLEITEAEFEYVQDSEKKLPLNEIFEGYLQTQYETVRSLLKYIQAFDGVFSLDPELRSQSSYEWSTDGSSWHNVPDKRPTSWRGANLLHGIPENFMGNISQLATEGVPVFSAFHYLYKGYEETIPRFKWINGTIAAELAFKEFLTLLDPHTESLMFNIPSPPLEKLYKNVLESYVGQASTMYKHLQKGAAKRNELIHRPASPQPDLQETNIYLHQVEVAIFELYTFLRPGHSFLTFALNGANQRLKHVQEGGAYFQ